MKLRLSAGLASALCVASVLACSTALAERSCERIVSLAPSLTELVFALHLDSQLAAVTDYCLYPPEARAKPHLGGLFNINLEALMMKRPSLVLTLAEHRALTPNLSKLGIPFYSADHRSIGGIKSSIRELGKLCDRDVEASQLLAALEQSEAGVRARIQERPRASRPLRALVALGGELQAGQIVNVYISGSDGFYSELLKMAGAENVLQNMTSPMPLISLEGLAKLKPDLIFHILSEPSERAHEADFGRAWQRAISMLEPATHSQVFILSADYASIPGPRYPQLLDEFERDTKKALLGVQ